MHNVEQEFCPQMYVQASLILGLTGLQLLFEQLTLEVYSLPEIFLKKYVIYFVIANKKV